MKKVADVAKRIVNLLLGEDVSLPEDHVRSVRNTPFATR